MLEGKQKLCWLEEKFLFYGQMEKYKFDQAALKLSFFSVSAMKIVI